MSQRKKLYFLVNSLEWGGAERVIANLSRELSREHDISVITLKSGGFYELARGVRHIALSDVRNNLLMFALIPYYVMRLRSVLAHERFDNGVSFLEIANFVHILAKRDAIISSRIHLGFFVGVTGAIYRLLIRLLYPLAARIVVNSEENGYDISARLGIPQKRIVTIYNPIDTELVKKRMDEPISYDLESMKAGRRTYITVARLVWQKHHDRIIRAFAWLRDAGIRDFVYFIVGGGPEKERLESLARELDLVDHVVFFGEQSNIFPFLKSADCFVYASEFEWFPNVLIEAMACGLPIITSDFVSGAKECILGEYPKNSWKSLDYPYFGPNGVLIDLERFEEQFYETCAWSQFLERWWNSMGRFSQKAITQYLFNLIGDV